MNKQIIAQDPYQEVYFEDTPFSRGIFRENAAKMISISKSFLFLILTLAVVKATNDDDPMIVLPESEEPVPDLFDELQRSPRQFEPNNFVPRQGSGGKLSPRDLVSGKIDYGKN